MRLTLLLALLVAVAGVLARRRLRRARGRDAAISDDMVRRIERSGTLEYEPPSPLDLEQIREEEDDFWNQSWDEPEEL